MKFPSCLAVFRWLTLMLAAGYPLMELSYSQTEQGSLSKLVQQVCQDCHSGADAKGLFSVESLALNVPGMEELSQAHVFSLEQMLLKMRAGQMPPIEYGFEDGQLLDQANEELENLLEVNWQQRPFVPLSSGLRRLTRTEYQNAIRDLLGLQVDAASLLPKDQSSHGFDNITVGDLSPAYISRAITAAQQISRTVLGRTGPSTGGITIRIPANRTQEWHIEGLPLGTRGGTVFEYYFPQPGQYEFQVRLARDRNEMIEGLSTDSNLDLLVNRELKHRFNIPKPSNPNDHTLVDSHLKILLDLPAGRYNVGVTFPQTSLSLGETRRQPFQSAYNYHRHPRPHPAVYEVSIVGPLNSSQSPLVPDTQITRKIFNGQPLNPPADQQRHVARAVLGRLAELAYRRPLDQTDVESLMRYYDSAQPAGFSAGLELGLASILVNPNFLIRVEAVSSPEQAPGIELTSQVTTRQATSGWRPVSDLELASRLSFFLWSSIPDEQLLELAKHHRLSQPDVLGQQVQRMLQDPRSESLVSNFASQWLYLRNLDSLTPDLRLYTDFDDNLLEAMRQETLCLLREVMLENQSVLQLLRSDHTYLNQRLAAHYDMSGVLGSRMRPVSLPPGSRRGGILRHASILAVTSYATRTSPTIRGNFVLENILGTPTSPPPPNVPALKEPTDSGFQTTRQRLAIHRQDASCAGCHDLIDPIGFALENYDALGGWRNFENELPIDAQGQLPDGSHVASPAELEEWLLMRPKLFVGTMVRKLVTFGLGRGIDPHESPLIRRIVRRSGESDYRFFAIIDAIISSPIFQMRNSE